MGTRRGSVAAGDGSLPPRTPPDPRLPSTSRPKARSRPRRSRPSFSPAEAAAAEAASTSPLRAPRDFAGPIPPGGRPCTDPACASLLVLAWLAMTVLGIHASVRGDYRLVLHPLDYAGNLCGVDNGSLRGGGSGSGSGDDGDGGGGGTRPDLTAYPYLYYVNSFGGGVCVDRCPQIPEEDGWVDPRTLVTYGGIHQAPGGGAVVDPTFVAVADYGTSDPDRALRCSSPGRGGGMLDLCYPYGSVALSWRSPGINAGFGYAYYAVDTREVFWRCVPSLAAMERLRELTGYAAHQDELLGGGGGGGSGGGGGEPAGSAGTAASRAGDRHGQGSGGGRRWGRHLGGGTDASALLGAGGTGDGPPPPVPPPASLLGGGGGGLSLVDLVLGVGYTPPPTSAPTAVPTAPPTPLPTATASEAPSPWPSQHPTAAESSPPSARPTPGPTVPQGRRPVVPPPGDGGRLRDVPVPSRSPPPPPTSLVGLILGEGWTPRPTSGMTRPPSKGPIPGPGPGPGPGPPPPWLALPSGGANGTDAYGLFAAFEGVGVDEAMGLFYPNGTTTGTAEGLDLPSSLHPTLRQTLTDGQFWGRLFGDMWTARNYVLGVGFGLSIAVGLVYVRLLRVPCLLPFMVWGSIALGCGVVLYAGYYARTLALRWEAADPPTHPQQNIDAVRTASYLLWAAGTVLVAMFVCLFQRLVLSMKCVKKTGRALGAMPLIVLFPVVQALGLAAFLGVFLAYGICLAGMGTMSTRTHEVGAAPFQYSVSVRTFQYEDPVEYAGWYLLFVLFWTSQFVVAVGEIVIAMAVSRWYFARDKKRINSGAVWSSLTATLRCHAGTAAFGALIIAVVKLIRAGVAKLQTEAKRMDAKTAQILLCLFQCVIWLFEKVLRFFNQQAYVQTAIFGTGFFVSAREGFFLAARNAGRVAAIAYVSGMTALVGKFVIVAVTAAMGYVAMQNHLGDEIYSAVGPTFLVAVISYFVAGMFMAIFDTCATTVLHCFIADEEMFGDDPGGRYAEEKLVAFVDKHGSEEATYASDGEEDSLD